MKLRSNPVRPSQCGFGTRPATIAAPPVGLPGRFFGLWLLAANLLWLATPWLDTLEPTFGAAWLWTLVIPAVSLAALYPRRCAGLLLAAGALPLWLLGALPSRCRFRIRRRRQGPDRLAR